MDTIIDMPQDSEIKQEVTLSDLAAKVDIIGQQLNWLIENLQTVFMFVQQVGSNGGGIRGMLKAIKTAEPQMMTMEEPKNAG